MCGGSVSALAKQAKQQYVRWGGGCGTPEQFGTIVGQGTVEFRGKSQEITIVEPYVTTAVHDAINKASYEAWSQGMREASVGLDGLLRGIRVFSGPPTDHNLITEAEFIEATDKLEAAAPEPPADYDEDGQDDADEDEL